MVEAVQVVGKPIIIINIERFMKNNYFLYGLGAIALIIIMWGISTHNRLIKMEGAIDGFWAQIENNLQRRYDLIPNLVATVKGYAQHEEDVFTEIADARAKLAGGAGNVSQTAEASQNMESAIGRLLAISESYPELKANQGFLDLQVELAGTENRLATSRRDYNNSVKSYNVAIKSIPTNFIANFMGLAPKSFFEISVNAQNNVEVDFQR